MTVIKKLIETKHYSSALVLINNMIKQYGSTEELEKLKKVCQGS
jgi:hypothetical protein